MKIAIAHKQSAFKIKHWYLIHHRVMEFQVNGTEAFTLFEKLTAEKQKEITEKIPFNPTEIPVLVLTVKDGIYVVNTSERFVKITSQTIDSVYYDEFEALFFHQPIHYKIRKLSPLKLVEIGIKKTNGDIVFWNIPAGEFYQFWDVTRRLETIRILK